jgi:hypothetical protein
MSPAESAPEGYLRANAAAYEWLVRRIVATDREKDPEALLTSVQRAALFAGQFHAGRFADGNLENVAFAFGASLEVGQPATTSLRLPAGNPARRRHVLHVTTRIPSLAGHTRMLAHWVSSDETSRHSVVVLDQDAEPCPSWLSDVARASGGGFISLEGGSALTRARHLRALARQGVDLVVLHHHSWDAVPTIAFAAIDCPPVALLNHADHEFWLGSSVADIVINLRTAGAEHTQARRFVSSNAVMPVPLSKPLGGSSKAEVRRALGMRQDEVVLLTVGRGVKYRPSGSHDFFATARQILDGNPGSRLFLVGETAAGIAPYLREPIHERLQMVGPVEDPTPYRDAADVYLESFPFGSQTALLEACLSGLPAVPAYAPLFPLLVANDDDVTELLPNPRSEQEYIVRAGELIGNPGERARLGEALRTRLLCTHVGHHWTSQLHRVYESTDRLVHDPRPIPASSCMATGADIGLSLRQIMTDGGASPGAGADGPGYHVLSHATNVAKMVGDGATARACAWRAVCHYPLRRGPWRRLLGALLGRAGARLIRGQVTPWQ